MGRPIVKKVSQGRNKAIIRRIRTAFQGRSLMAIIAHPTKKINKHSSPWLCRRTDKSAYSLAVESNRFTGRIGLLHVHMSSRASTWRKSLFLLTGMMFRVPYLIHLHSPDFVDFFEQECGERRKKLIRFLLSRALYVIALSPGWAKDIKKISPATRTVILFNSVPLPAIALREKEIDESGSDPGDPPLILFLGHAGKRKGTFDLIRAVALLSENFKLVIGGDGELQQAQMLSEELGVSDKILFTGWLGRAEKDHLLARAAIFVLPSYHEGVPMAILEAMSWEIPIVTTPVGGIPEVVTEGQEGLLVNSGDIVGLAHALSRLLAAPSLRREFGERGRHKIESRFSIKILQPQLEQLWIDSGVSRPEPEPGLMMQRGEVDAPEIQPEV